MVGSPPWKAKETVPSSDRDENVQEIREDAISFDMTPILYVSRCVETSS